MPAARSAIEEALYRYAWGFDQGDMDVLASAFTEDAEYFGLGDPLKGRAAIRDFLARLRASQREREEQSRHVISNVLILGQSDSEATLTSYFTVFRATRGTLQPRSSGWYEDTVVPDGESWRIRTRHAHRDGSVSR